jgi:hypothetical protein
MMLGAHFLTAMKNTPTSHTSVLQKVSTTKELSPFTVTHSSYAESSLITCVDTMSLPTAPMSSTLARKVYKVVKKIQKCYTNHNMWEGSHHLKILVTLIDNPFYFSFLLFF